MTDWSPDVVFQLRKSKTTTKRRLGITEALVSETILSTCGNSACDRGAFAPSLAVRNSSRSSQSRAEHRKSISLWTSATCLVPVPGAYLPTLPVFPVEYRKTGPATGPPEILWFLPEFNQPDTSVHKNWNSVGARPETAGKMKAIHITTHQICIVISCVRRVVCFGPTLITMVFVFEIRVQL